MSSKSTTKSTGLAAFTRKSAPVAVSTEERATAAKPGERKRGKGDFVALTVRLPRADWERLHQLAVGEGTSLQQLALRGFSKLFKEKGLPGIKS